jgi:hypothetical protein
MSSRAELLARLTPWLVLALALVFSVERLRSGIDLEDEATHIAIPYRFVLGDRPFVDEINPIQSAGFITRPLIWAWVHATGGADGIVLFTRVAYLLACAGVACIAFRFARRHVDGGLAPLCVAPIVVQMPGIVNLDYHTIGSLGFTAGVFAVAHGLRGERRRGWIFLGGVLHALATIAIQVYFAAALIFAIAAVLWLSRERKPRSLAPYVAGGLVTALVFAPAFLDLGRETIEYALEHTSRTGSGFPKARFFLRNQLRLIPNPIGSGIALAVLLVASRRGWRIPALLAWLSLPVLAFQDRGEISANVFVTVTAMLAPFLYLALRDRAPARPLFLGIWLPSFLAGLVLAWFSSVHLLSEGYPQLPASIASTLIALRLVREIWPRHAFWPAIAWTTVVIASFVWFQRQPYNDDPLDRLDTTVVDGPWRGIRTTRAKAEFMAAIQSDVRSFATPTTRVLFFQHFPAGYLMSAMRPAASSVWAITCQPEPWQMCANELDSHLDRLAGTDLVVFEVKQTFHRENRIDTLGRGPAHAVLECRMRAVIDTPDYAVFEWPGSR